ncbi:hypothetical protein ACFSC3_12670 [Sphingomonas floccifaciens]|uniref:TonB-dependent receptor plug domain-containing protein n=1 Tax=Sphingomonas floccifaciens TaxID=1844115 RepID=A0ABW4NEA1_9SPHN
MSRASLILARSPAIGAMLSSGATAQVVMPPSADPPPTEVVVKGRRMGAQSTLQGTAYPVADSPQGAAGSAVDVLNALPSVSVAPDGSVRVRGNDSVRIFVNGRPSAGLNGAGRGAALEAIAGGNIASVEVLTNPSVRDDADGGTILNIVLKKPRVPGPSGKANVTVGDRGRRTLSVNAGLNRGRVKALLDAGFRQDVRLQTVRDERRLLDQDGGVTARFDTLSRYTPTLTRSASLGGSLSYALPADAEVSLEASVSHAAPINQLFEDHRDVAAGDVLPALYRRVRTGPTPTTTMTSACPIAKRRMTASRPCRSMRSIA